jgi:kynurenine 3-monooxygenase
MSELSADSRFLLRKKIEVMFHDAHPELWVPLYSMVTFSPEISYSQALKVGDQQKAIMDTIMSMDNIEEQWDSAHVHDKLFELASNTFTTGAQEN